MVTIGLWRIEEKGPERLQTAELAAERDLEDWIERDPALLEQGLTIVGRQIRLEGGPLDLLALDAQGRWVLIEIKRERLRREVVTQAIDYVSCLHRADHEWLRAKCNGYLQSRGSTHSLDSLLQQRGRSLDSENEDRDVVIYLVGTSIDVGLERMVGFLSVQAELSVRMVTFSVFRNQSGGLVLAREIHERVDQSPVEARTTPPAPSLWAKVISVLRSWLRSTQSNPGKSAGSVTTDGNQPQARIRPAESTSTSPTAGPKGARESKSAPKVEDLLAVADKNGVGGVVRTLYATATGLGLHVRPWGASIMFAPPSSKNRCLFTVWVESRVSDPGAAKVWVASDMFSQFYGISEQTLTATLGVGPLASWLWLDQQKAERMAGGLLKVLGESGR